MDINNEPRNGQVPGSKLFVALFRSRSFANANGTKYDPNDMPSANQIAKLSVATPAAVPFAIPMAMPAPCARIDLDVFS